MNRPRIDKNVRGYLGAGLVFLISIGILVFLAFVEIPTANNDVFKLVIGVLVGSLGAVIHTIIGKDPDEVNELKKENEALRQKNIELTKRVDQLESMFTNLQGAIIERLTELSPTATKRDQI